MLLGWLAFATARAEEEPWRARDLVTDASGQVWGILGRPSIFNRAHDDEAFREIGAFNPAYSQWDIHPYLGAPSDSLPQRLGRLADGRAVCLWRSGDQSVVTILQTGMDVCRTIINEKFADPRLLPLSDGGLAITESGPQVARIAKIGGAAVVSRIPDGLMNTGDRADPAHPCAGIHAVQCDDGSVWLWSWSLVKPGATPHLTGFVRWTPESIEHVQGLPFDEKLPISEVVADGREHLFVAQAGVGLMVLNLASLTIVSVNAPSDFAYIQNMALVKGALHVVTCLPPTETAIGSKPTPVSSGTALKTVHNLVASGRMGVLWRVSGSAVPEMLIKGLDRAPAFGSIERPFFATFKGLLVGAVDSAPWWLPNAADGKPFLLDRSQGVPVNSIKAIATVGDDRFIARAAEDAVVIAPLPADQPRASTSRRDELQTRGPLLQDSRHHLWGLRLVEGDFAEWDGNEWHPHPMPKNWDSALPHEFVADRHDHGWLISGLNDRTPVLDFTTGTWEVFDTLEQAVAARLTPGDQLVTQLDLAVGPISHTNGIKCFFSRDRVLHALRYGQWTNTRTDNLGAATSMIFLPPWFNAQGALRVHLTGKCFEFNDDGRWTEARGVDLLNDRAGSSAPPGYGRLPAGCMLPGVEFHRSDRFGVTWLVTREGELWKWLDGRGVKLRDIDGSKLWHPNTRVREMLFDAAHNIFLRDLTRFGREPVCRYEVVYSGPAPGILPAALARVEAGTALIQLHPGKGVWHRWRLDEAAWHPFAQPAELKLESLPAGAYHVDIEAFDEELTPLGDMQTLAFIIKAADLAEFAKQIHQLASADLNAREAAARVLEAQGKAALPALKHALADPGADATQQWWLSAIIQHIEGR